MSFVLRCMACKEKLIVEARVDKCPKCRNRNTTFLQYYENTGNEEITSQNKVKGGPQKEKITMKNEQKNEYAGKIVDFIKSLDSELDATKQRMLCSAAYHQLTTEIKGTSVTPKKASTKKKSKSE